ncbi:MAG TPA: tetratricopeptide repeat protein, partial [Gemmatimonadales bacterium]|nr:tetratricopeptide repeat protein [Gemmatimonadales bacterium]
LGDYHSYVTADNARALEYYARAQRIAPNDAEILSGAALSESSLGRWDAALEHFEQAHALDPRSFRTAHRLARTYLWLRRYREAMAAADRALTLEPASPAGIQLKGMIFLARGDLGGARRALAAAPREADPTTLVSYMAQFWDLFWVLDDRNQQLLLRLGQGPFGESREGWALALAGTHALRGNAIRAAAYADTARTALEERLRQGDDAQLRVLLGTALAYLGRKDAAIREGKRAVEMLPVSREAFVGPYIQHQLARIYILVGEPELALDQLVPLLGIPYFLSPGWLKIDPTFEPLRGNARFERLVGE